MPPICSEHPISHTIPHVQFTSPIKTTPSFGFAYHDHNKLVARVKTIIQMVKTRVHSQDMLKAGGGTMNIWH